MVIKQVVDDLLQKAIEVHTSDVFFLVKEKKVVVFFRQNSKIKVETSFTLEEGQEVVNFLKYAAQMNIAEHRRPQVGALNYKVNGEVYYLRLSSLGDFCDEESLVIRIIYQIEASNYFFPEQLGILANLARKKGLIVTSGPTGSGKTTTMYKLAKNVGIDKMVMTIEDPVEVKETSFLQTQVNNEAQINYQTLLAAALRHRPDILVIGEIRDTQTARLAVDAALSGHLVLATVHAKSTLQTISRLEGLHISTSELANCLTAVSYQRLLPTAGGLACLLDICYGHELLNNINKNVRGNFISWQKNLTSLVKTGKIGAQDYNDFKEG